MDLHFNQGLCKDVFKWKSTFSVFSFTFFDIRFNEIEKENLLLYIIGIVVEVELIKRLKKNRKDVVLRNKFILCVTPFFKVVFSYE